MRFLDDDRFNDLLRVRAEDPSRIQDQARRRVRRPLLEGDGNLLIIAFDHPARRMVGVGDRPFAMADRREALERCIRALRRPGVDGILATPDVVDDLILLGELDSKIVFGSMNRGGLTGSVWESDDRFTAYDSRHLVESGLDGGKMLLRLAYDDPGTNQTMAACAHAVTELARAGLVALIEPLPAKRDDRGRLQVETTVELMVEAVSIASALGASSAYTWLKLPAVDDPERMVAATTLPCLLLGGDPGSNSDHLLDLWKRAMQVPNVRGLTAGRSLLFPEDGNVERWVDAAVELVHGG